MLPGLVLAALVVAAATVSRTGWWGPCVLVAVSIWWIVVNGPMEGEVLLVLTPDNGITAADLAGVAGVVVALVQLGVLVARSDRT